MPVKPGLAVCNPPLGISTTSRGAVGSRWRLATTLSPILSLYDTIHETSEAKDKKLKKRPRLLPGRFTFGNYFRKASEAASSSSESWSGWLAALKPSSFTTLINILS